MADPERLDTLQLKKRRERAKDWMQWASWAAYLGAVGYSVLLLSSMDSLLENPTGALDNVLAVAMQVLLGYQVRRAHQLAAGSLAAGYLFTALYRTFVLGDLSGVIARAGLVVVYVRGFLAAVDYVELEKEYGPEPVWRGGAAQRAPE